LKTAFHSGSGSSSGVERKLPKLDVAGSTPVSRSIFLSPPMSILYGSFTFLILLISCGPKPTPSESPLDTPENHFRRGVAQIERGDLFGAQREFERARSLDPHFPGVFVGTGLVALEQGDFWMARKEIEKAIHEDENFIDAYLALSRTIALEAKTEDKPAEKWLGDALRPLVKAEKINPEEPAVHYQRGWVNLQGLQFPAGREAFSRVIEINRGEWVEKAMRQMETIQMVERAAPGSRAGMKIALVPEITRGELGVLLVEELKLPELVRKRGKMEPSSFKTPRELDETNSPGATDLEGAWAKPWIEEVLVLGISGLELFPDGTFQPDLPVTRANYALVNQGLLILLSGDPALASLHIGEETPFPDVRSDFYAFNAISLSTERGIMEADKLSGHFHPHNPVSGAEALLMMRELQNAFRMEF
jgi:tetratricopeptide (TPR) repeat protein